MTDIFGKIRELFDENKIIYRTILDHPPTFTSAESAKVRRESMAIGGKALVVKINKEFKLFVLSAVCQFDTKAARKYFNAKKSRFATKEELMDLTGLVPGSVPPFGPPILNLPLYVDPSVQNQKIIGFNVGSLTDSIIMNTEDYIRIAKPEVFSFAKENTCIGKEEK